MSQKLKSPIHIIVLLILAGEAIFVLPFVIARVFRPTFLAAYDLTNYELGICFSIYGVVALFSYILGGRLADKYPPHSLMAVALLLTALGGFVMAIFPNYSVMKYLFGYYGFTTIYLFWGAMIKAARIWGGDSKQGRAFGFLDGGRGLVAASFALLGLAIFSFFLAKDIAVDIDTLSLSERKSAFRNVILVSSLFVAITGILVLFFMRQNSELKQSEKPTIFSIANFLEVAKLKSVWWLMIIILCAYVGYKITDDFSLYASEVMNYNEVESAKIGTLMLFIRPIIGVSIGLLADRTKPVLILMIGFILTTLGSILLSLGIMGPSMLVFFIVSIVIVAVGVYSARTLYFAVLGQAKVPVYLTGTAVGMISFVGYMPDIFMGPTMGHLLDNYEGELGHQYVFLMNAGFAFLGLIAAFFFRRSMQKV
ncbi:MAG: nitrate/nitrite transporter [Crocinitomicaceae bacterium]